MAKNNLYAGESFLQTPHIVAGNSIDVKKYISKICVVQILRVAKLIMYSACVSQMCTYAAFGQQEKTILAAADTAAAISCIFKSYGGEGKMSRLFYACVHCHPRLGSYKKSVFQSFSFCWLDVLVGDFRISTLVTPP